MKRIYSTLIVTVTVLLLWGNNSHAQHSLSLKVGTYNIRYDNRGDQEKGNGWQQRVPAIVSIIQWEDIDVLGMQEVLAHQLKDLRTALNQEYASFGVGRDDGKDKGEFAPIFFKKDKFALLDSGAFWLSETPDKPSKGWDAALPRICTWVHLKERRTKKDFLFFNLHMDHVGVLAREQSCHLVLKKMKELAGKKTAFLTGDFNVDQNNTIYNILQGSGYVQDAYELAGIKHAWNGTFNAFDSDLWTASRIDHIFLTQKVTVSNYAVLTETYRSKSPENTEDVKKGDFPKELSFKKYISRLPSDHFPVLIRLKF
ncbi:MAG: endonuclease/exonuclease/phosphatase family protein [Niabella sp.]